MRGFETTDSQESVSSTHQKETHTNEEIRGNFPEIPGELGPLSIFRAVQNITPRRIFRDKIPLTITVDKTRGSGDNERVVGKKQETIDISFAHLLHLIETSNTNTGTYRQLLKKLEDPQLITYRKMVFQMGTLPISVAREELRGYKNKELESDIEILEVCVQSTENDHGAQGIRNDVISQITNRSVDPNSCLLGSLIVPDTMNDEQIAIAQQEEERVTSQNTKTALDMAFAYPDDESGDASQLIAGDNTFPLGGVVAGSDANAGNTFNGDYVGILESLSTHPGKELYTGIDTDNDGVLSIDELFGSNLFQRVSTQLYTYQYDNRQSILESDLDLINLRNYIHDRNTPAGYRHHTISLDQTIENIIIEYETLKNKKPASMMMVDQSGLTLDEKKHLAFSEFLMFIQGQINTPAGPRTNYAETTNTIINRRLQEKGMQEQREYDRTRNILDSDEKVDHLVRKFKSDRRYRDGDYQQKNTLYQEYVDAIECNDEHRKTTALSKLWNSLIYTNTGKLSIFGLQHIATQRLETIDQEIATYYDAIETMRKLHTERQNIDEPSIQATRPNLHYYFLITQYNDLRSSKEMLSRIMRFPPTGDMAGLCSGLRSANWYGAIPFAGQAELTRQRNHQQSINDRQKNRSDFFPVSLPCYGGSCSYIPSEVEKELLNEQLRENPDLAAGSLSFNECMKLVEYAPSASLSEAQGSDQFWNRVLFRAGQGTPNMIGFIGEIALMPPIMGPTGVSGLGRAERLQRVLGNAGGYTLMNTTRLEHTVTERMADKSIPLLAYVGVNDSGSILWLDTPGEGFREAFVKGALSNYIEYFSEQLGTAYFGPGLASLRKNILPKEQLGIITSILTPWIRNQSGNAAQITAMLQNKFNRDGFVSEYAEEIISSRFSNIVTGDRGSRNPLFWDTEDEVVTMVSVGLLGAMMQGSTQAITAIDTRIPIDFTYIDHNGNIQTITFSGPQRNIFAGLIQQVEIPSESDISAIVKGIISQVHQTHPLSIAQQAALTAICEQYLRYKQYLSQESNADQETIASTEGLPAGYTWNMVYSNIYEIQWDQMSHGQSVIEFLIQQGAIPNALSEQLVQIIQSIAWHAHTNRNSRQSGNYISEALQEGVQIETMTFADKKAEFTYIRTSLLRLGVFSEAECKEIAKLLMQSGLCAEGKNNNSQEEPTDETQDETNESQVETLDQKIVSQIYEFLLKINNINLNSSDDQVLAQEYKEKSNDLIALIRGGVAVPQGIPSELAYEMIREGLFRLIKVWNHDGEIGLAQQDITDLVDSILPGLQDKYADLFAENFEIIISEFESLGIDSIRELIIEYPELLYQLSIFRDIRENHPQATFEFIDSGQNGAVFIIDNEQVCKIFYLSEASAISIEASNQDHFYQALERFKAQHPELGDRIRIPYIDINNQAESSLVMERIHGKTLLYYSLCAAFSSDFTNLHSFIEHNKNLSASLKRIHSKIQGETSDAKILELLSASELSRILFLKDELGQLETSLGSHDSLLSFLYFLNTNQTKKDGLRAVSEVLKIQGIAFDYETYSAWLKQFEEFARQQGLTHKDFHFGNVMISIEDGQVIIHIIDFGDISIDYARVKEAEENFEEQQKSQEQEQSNETNESQEESGWSILLNSIKDIQRITEENMKQFGWNGEFPGIMGSTQALIRLLTQSHEEIPMRCLGIVLGKSIAELGISSIQGRLTSTETSLVALQKFVQGGATVAHHNIIIQLLGRLDMAGNLLGKGKDTFLEENKEEVLQLVNSLLLGLQNQIEFGSRPIQSENIPLTFENINLYIDPYTGQIVSIPVNALDFGEFAPRGLDPRSIAMMVSVIAGKPEYASPPSKNVRTLQDFYNLITNIRIENLNEIDFSHVASLFHENNNFLEIFAISIMFAHYIPDVDITFFFKKVKERQGENYIIQGLDRGSTLFNLADYITQIKNSGGSDFDIRETLLMFSQFPFLLKTTNFSKIQQMYPKGLSWEIYMGGGLNGIILNGRNNSGQDIIMKFARRGGSLQVEGITHETYQQQLLELQSLGKVDSRFFIPDILNIQETHLTIEKIEGKTLMRLWFEKTLLENGYSQDYLDEFAQVSDQRFIHMTVSTNNTIKDAIKYTLEYDGNIGVYSAKYIWENQFTRDIIKQLFSEQDADIFIAMTNAFKENGYQNNDLLNIANTIITPDGRRCLIDFGAANMPGNNGN